MKTKTLKIYLSLCLTASTLPGQSTENTEASLPYYELDPMVIESSPLAPAVGDLSQAWCVHQGEELNWLRAQTIGETLAFDSGIAQTYYGPNASRPVIRGQDGQRVRVLQNGLEMFDVSASSVDHAVAVDPLLVERIEVLRGSSALLYGSNAIGGVVNTIDRTIPTRAYGEPVYGQARTGYTDVNDGWNTGGVVFAEADSFVFQGNATYRETEDYDTPSFRLPDGTRVDSVANSQSETYTAGFGGSYLLENGYIGASYSRFDTEYGVPNEEAPTIDVERDRIELRGAVAPQSSDWIDNIEVQFAYGDYNHDEIEPEGDIAVTFERKGLESRAAVVHSSGDLEGVFGFQGNFDELTVAGEENFFAGLTTNPTIEEEDTQRLALFVLEEYTLSPELTLNGGARLEYLNRQFKGADNRDDFTASASTGAVFKLADGWSIGGNLNYTEREPETAELFSDGPHLATEAYEIGDPSLEKETAYGIEFILARNKGAVDAFFSVFYTYFDDYIFLADTGVQRNPDGVILTDPIPADEEVLVERIYRSVSAEFYGLESEVEWNLYETDDWIVDLRGFGDVIWARNTSDDDDLPRTPPWRIGTSVNVVYRNFSLFADITHTGEQQNTVAGEDTTGSYTLLGLRAAYNWETEHADTELFIRGRNLTDDLARVHTSFLRDTAPLPGRGVEVGLNVRY